MENHLEDITELVDEISFKESITDRKLCANPKNLMRHLTSYYIREKERMSYILGKLSSIQRSRHGEIYLRILDDSGKERTLEGVQYVGFNEKGLGILLNNVYRME